MFIPVTLSLSHQSFYESGPQIFVAMAQKRLRTTVLLKKRREPQNLNGAEDEMRLTFPVGLFKKAVRLAEAGAFDALRLVSIRRRSQASCEKRLYASFIKKSQPLCVRVLKMKVNLPLDETCAATKFASSCANLQKKCELRRASLCCTASIYCF